MISDVIDLQKNEMIRFEKSISVTSKTAFELGGKYNGVASNECRD